MTPIVSSIGFLSGLRGKLEFSFFFSCPQIYLIITIIYILGKTCALHNQPSALASLPGRDLCLRNIQVRCWTKVYIENFRAFLSSCSKLYFKVFISLSNLLEFFNTYIPVKNFVFFFVRNVTKKYLSVW